MIAMEPLYATVEENGQLEIPAKIREALGIEPGMRLILRIEGKRAVIEVDDVRYKHQLIDQKQGCTANLPSGTDMLLHDRRIERSRELSEEGW